MPLRWIAGLAPLVGLVLLIASPAPAQTGPTLGQAFGLIGQQDFAAAESVLVLVTAAQPGNGQAWNLLGYCRIQRERPAEAIAAYERGAAIPASAPLAAYNLGLLQAQEGNLDEAFAWLEKAKPSRDVSAAALDPDVGAILTADPRWLALLPGEAEFSDPFVEPTRILHEWRGETQNDQFGWIARNIGDVDGDGADDAVVSAPTYDVKGGEDGGKVYVYSGRSGELLWSAVGEAGDNLGQGIEAAGDVNADGIPDVIAGGPAGDRVVIYSGNDGAVLFDLHGEEGEAYGHKVSDVGDVNGDGHADVFVGAPQNDAAGEDAGRAFILSGADASVLHEWRGREPGEGFGTAGAGRTADGTSLILVGAPGAGGGRVYVFHGLADEPAFVAEADSTGNSLGGMFLSVVGDVNADGVQDVYLSDWSNTAKGRSTGRIYVRSGDTGEPLYVLTGETAGEGFGIGPADAGDVDGDGHDDLVIGAWQYAGAAPSGGKVTLFSGKDGSVLRAWTGKVAGETFGFDATGLGDVDGDGTVDLLVTSAWSAVHGARSGRVYVISSGD